jgi:hypothetical protein
MGPPASISKVRPCGVTSSVESPSPTSIEVISNTPGCVRGVAGMNAIPKEAPRMAASPAIARAGRRRAAHIASTSAAAASAMTSTDGMATRRSASRRAPTLSEPSPRTVPVIPSSANVVRSTGTLASQGETYARASAATAAGIISWVKGTTIRLEGNPMVVARWK